MIYHFYETIRVLFITDLIMLLMMFFMVMLVSEHKEPLETFTGWCVLITLVFSGFIAIAFLALTIVDIWV